jgi:glyoxylase-like metal-dependent hydrolase (beta-lactamase superfamily II)
MAALPASLSRVTVGDIAVTFVPDGLIRMPPAGSFGDGVTALFDANRHLLDETGDMVMSLGALLVETAGKRVLVDLAWGPSAIDLASLSKGKITGRIQGGDLLRNLASLGIAPGDVDLVLLSHLHADHIGWLVTDTPTGPAPTFTAAEHCLAVAEWDFWQGPDSAGFAAGPLPQQCAVLQDRLRPVEDGDCPVAGVNVLFTPGHTPGHCSFVVSDHGERAVVLGDTVHCVLEIANPELELLGDINPRLASATRQRLRAMLGEPDGPLAVAAHLPDTVFGRVVAGPTTSGWEMRPITV